MFQNNLKDKMVQKKIVAVIGGHSCGGEVEQIAHELGFRLAEVVEYIACGGLSGVMKAVCKGFKAGDGITIGILPGYDKKDANEYVDIALPTGMGLARNVLVVKSADVVVALPGEAGTLSEIAYCLQLGVPVISLNSWEIPGAVQVKTVEEALAEVNRILKGI